jgi:hypothetical protein
MTAAGFTHLIQVVPLREGAQIRPVVVTPVLVVQELVES